MDEPEHRPDQPDNPTGLEKSKGRKGKSRVSLALLSAGIFAFLAAWAGLLGNLGHTLWIFAACVMLIASVCGALALRLELRNHHWLRWQYNGLAWVIIVLAFVLGFIVWEIHRSESQPHLKLILNTADSPDANVALTNDFILFKSEEFDLLGSSGYLIVPVPPGRLSATLKLSVINDSPVTADAMQLSLSIPKALEYSSNSWERVRSKAFFGQRSEREEMLTFGVRSRVPILPGDGNELPELKFPKLDAWTNLAPRLPMIVQMRAKDMPVIWISFWVCFPATTNLTMPHIVRGKNDPERGPNMILITIPKDR